MSEQDLAWFTNGHLDCSLKSCAVRERHLGEAFADHGIHGSDDILVEDTVLGSHGHIAAVRLETLTLLELFAQNLDVVFVTDLRNFDRVRLRWTRDLALPSPADYLIFSSGGRSFGACCPAAVDLPATAL